MFSLNCAVEPGSDIHLGDHVWLLLNRRDKMQAVVEGVIVGPPSATQERVQSGQTRWVEVKVPGVRYDYREIGNGTLEVPILLQGRRTDSFVKALAEAQDKVAQAKSQIELVETEKRVLKDALKTAISESR